MYMPMRIWWEVSVGDKITVEKLQSYFYRDCIKRKVTFAKIRLIDID